MNKRFPLLVLCGVLVFLFCGRARADVVVLDNGTTITGKAQITSRAVRIETHTGVLTVPLWRVVRASAGSVGARSPQAAREPETGATPPTPAGAKAQAEPKMTAGDGVLRALDALESRISVSFTDVPLAEAITYLQEVTGANVSYRMSDLEADDTPVTLNLRDVKVRQVLDLLLEERGLAWSVREDIIRIRPGTESQELTMRVYDVRDLLADDEDRLASRTATARETTSRSGDENGLGQSASDYGSSSSSFSATYGTTGVAGATTLPSVSERAYSLAVLITETVRPESWARPAVIAAGGMPDSGGGVDTYDNLW